MNSPLRLLHLEDDLNDAELIQSKLEMEGIDCVVTLVKSRADFEAALASHSYDLVVSDFSVPDYNGLEALSLIKQTQPDVPFILVSGTLGEDQAVESLKRGATDYILKSRLARLAPAVRRALQDNEKRAELKQAEEEIRQSEYKYRHLFESLSEAAFLIEESSGQIIDTNPQAERLLGLDREHIIGKPLESFHPSDHHVADPKESEARSGIGFPSQGQAAVITTARGLTPVDISAAPITLYDKKVILALYRDVSERVRAEEQIREQARLLDLAQDAITVRDMEGRLLYANKAGEKLLGGTTAELAGQKTTVSKYADVGLLESARNLAVENGEWSGELRLAGSDGKEIIVFSRWTLVRDQEGHPRSVLIIDTDITEKKRLEDQFLRVQRMEGIGTLASGIAHDLNNILTPILMAGPLLRWDRSQVEVEKTLAILESNAKRGAEIVRQLLTFGRGVEGERGPVQVKHLLKEMQRIVRETFPKTIVSTLKMSADLWPVMGDATQLHQVLLNLCVNARDAMPAGGQLTLKAENALIDTAQAAVNPGAAAGRYILLTVTDTGEGIPSTIIDRIFDPFFTTKPVGKGTGLGLSTVLGIVKSHGGFINVQSEARRGSTFSVHLPAAPEGPLTAEISHESPEIKRGDGEFILVVDDEVRIREVTQVLLEEHGYSVFSAEDGIEALTVFAREKDRVNLVLTDLLMPILDGVSLVRGLRKMSPTLKIIVTSGVGSSNTLRVKQIELESLGISNILFKPFRADELMNTIHTLLHQKS